MKHMPIEKYRMFDRIDQAASSTKPRSGVRLTCAMGTKP